MTVSRYRTPIQMEKIKNAESVGYVHHRDSDYRLRGRYRRLGCLSILFGRVTGTERAMIIYPDGSVETQAPKRGGSRTVTFNRIKLLNALRTHGLQQGEIVTPFEDA